MQTGDRAAKQKNTSGFGFPRAFPSDLAVFGRERWLRTGTDGRLPDPNERVMVVKVRFNWGRLPGSSRLNDPDNWSV